MKKKVVQTVVLLLLLVVFPILSWLFLKDGLQYRLDVKERLTQKATLPNNSDACSPGHIQVLYQNVEGAWDGRLKLIADQFHDRSEDVLFRPVDQLANDTARDSLQVSWDRSDLDGSYHDAVFLVDTTCALRMAYDVRSDDGMSELMADLIFLLPLEKEKDLLLKREREK